MRWSVPYLAACCVLLSSCSASQDFFVSKLDQSTSDVSPYTMFFRESNLNYPAWQFSVNGTWFLLRMDNSVRQGNWKSDPARDSTEITIAAWQSNPYARMKRISGTIVLRDGTVVQPESMSMLSSICLPGAPKAIAEPIAPHTDVPIAVRTFSSLSRTRDQDPIHEDVNERTCIRFVYRQKIAPSESFNLLVGTVESIQSDSYTMKLSFVPAIYVAHTH